MIRNQYFQLLFILMTQAKQVLTYDYDFCWLWTLLFPNYLVLAVFNALLIVNVGNIKIYVMSLAYHTCFTNLKFVTTNHP